MMGSTYVHGVPAEVTRIGFVASALSHNALHGPQPATACVQHRVLVLRMLQVIGNKCYRAIN